MISSNLRDKVIDYVAKKISIYELEEWMVPQLQSLIQYPNSANSDVVAAIELCLAELDLGIQSTEDTIKYMSNVLDEHSAIIVSSNYESSTVGSSSSTTATPNIINQINNNMVITFS